MGQAITFTGTGSDPDNDPLTYSIVAPPAHGSVSITNPSTGAFTYTPVPDFNGPVSFQFAVSDGYNPPTAPHTATITVNPVNDAPVANADSASGAEDGSVTVTTGTPNAGTYARALPRVALDEKNLASAFGAMQSLAMDFSVEDRTPEWMQQARCRGMSPAQFFPSDSTGVEIAQRIERVLGAGA